jgi:hypothetical protein
VIVVDDASSDDTAAVARSLGAQVIVREVNGGAAAARNDGIRAARHEWVALLDADDEWLPDHLATVWPHRGEHVLVAAAALVAGDDDAATRIHGVTRRARALPDPSALVFPENFVPASGALVRREAMLAAGGYRTERRFAEDFDAWLRLLGQGTGVALPTVTCVWRQHAAQKSRNPAAAAVQRAIVESYAGEAWWSPALVQRRLAVRAWDDLRAAQANGDRRAMLRPAAWLVARPVRSAAVLRILAWRLSHRRAARAVARDGGPRVHVLPGGEPPADAAARSADAVVDLRGTPGRWALDWLRRGPPGEAAGGRVHQRMLCRLFGVTWRGSGVSR